MNFQAKTRMPQKFLGGNLDYVIWLIPFPVNDFLVKREEDK